MIKNFRQDLVLFRDKLINQQNFTFSKYADGEWAVIKNTAINNSEFWFDPKNDNDQQKRHKLIESFKYKNQNYYVGISCPCCQGADTFNEMYEFSGQDEYHLTWANLWVNSNYSYYINNILPLYSTRNVILYCNKRGKINNLPFTPYMVIPVENNAWEHNWDLVETSKKIIDILPEKNMLFLFCCGPFGNILAYELTKYNSDHTYIDIGSTLNPFLQSEEFKRHYYLGNNMYSNLICTWGK